jgi:hypothetical protein
MNFAKITQNHGLWLIVTGFCLLTPSTALSVAPSIAKQPICSPQTLESLTTNLLRDLPNYANRASQRSRRLARKTDIFSYVILAGKPEFTPLPLKNNSYTPESQQTISPGVEQVFFTTLERQYVAGKVVEFQEFHWLLLTKAASGWRRVMMFSQTGSSQAEKMPTPPRESSNGYIGQAVDTWLRDCQAKGEGVRR